MSQTNTAAASSKSSLQSRLGTLVVIPWAGEYAEDGADMPFLMAYSLGDGVDGPEAGEAAVLAAAEEIGLPVGGAILDVSRASRARVTVLVEGGKAVLTMPYLHASCPVPDQWTAAAQARRAVYVILASRPWPEAAPGSLVAEHTLRSFAGDPEVLGTAAHFLVPVSSLKG
ncbi:hypothetical protein GA0115240_117010 [Streptomyces sp. DvalAA-14]|uniref:DUF5949 family protein n=1 Tax=unclassified Streptomyces TaxID=2593676 RepID=UPI00081BC628|nr:MULTISPECIES: DUF5949 family protein [unclassified Streptomyces]MYS20148.1 hypothetical protein [Streptomyces sp. SID4948]SCD62015.1 hypothetical protein GA0115240_117010 [Streptomyces sp. DvalAA-14]